MTGGAEWNYEAAARRILDLFPRIRTVAVTLGGGRHRDDYYRSTRAKERTLIDAWEESGAIAVDPILSSVIFTRSGQRLDTVQTPLTGEVADSTGAGDAWTAGYLHGILGGHELSTCAAMGDLVARCSLAAVGARAGLPSIEEFSAKLSALNKSSVQSTSGVH